MTRIGLLAVVIFAAAAIAQENPPATQPSDWHQRFEQVYGLKDDEILKRVAPPFIKERLEYFRTEKRSQAELIKEPPETFYFSFDGTVHCTGYRYARDVQTLNDVLTGALSLKTYEFDGPKELREIKLRGDWVIRSTAETPQLLVALADVINASSKHKIQFQSEEVKRNVIVASGQYEFHSLDSSRDKRSVHMYVDTLGDEDSGGGGSGNLEKFLTRIGTRVNMPVIDEVQGKRPVQISWRYHKSCYLSGLPEGDEKTKKVQKLLDALTEQTNLQFSVEERPMQVWIISEKPATKPAP